MPELIVKAGVQDTPDDYPISSNFYKTLNEEVAELIEEASRRAEANERKP